MRVSKYVKKAILKAHEHSKIVFKNDEIVRHWLEKKGFIDFDSENTEKAYRTGIYIDICNLGQGSADEFIKRLEVVEE